MELKDLFIEENLSIKEAIKRLDVTAKKILFVTKGNILKGSITDGDIRRWILKNGDLKESVRYIMNKKPRYINESEKSDYKKILKLNMIEALPVVTEKFEVIDIVFWNDSFEKKLTHLNKIDHDVVIMAGGQGKRLDPYTKVLPKPLIPIGDITIIERIIEKFTAYGCNKFHMTVNYKKNMIKAYFSELEVEYQINYVEEDKPLGTAGSLSFLKNCIDKTFFVSNCDILVDCDYYDMLKFHKERKNKITLVSSLKHYTIPYGIIKLNSESCVKDIIEKPEYDYLVNTGMYILEPEVLNNIPDDAFYNITQLINSYIEKGEKVGMYPVSDKSWLDMGELNEMENMLERLGVK